MIFFLQILYWSLVAAIGHTYIFYGMVLKLLARHRKNNAFLWHNNEQLPHIYILTAAYNEEKVIEQKLLSILQTTYPVEKWTLLVGSDGSSDATNAIVQRYAEQHTNNIQLYCFGGRNGKPNIINQLVALLPTTIFADSLLVMTDANVFFVPETLTALAQHFANPKVGMVGANILNILHQQKGISQQEQYYIQRENNIKYLEGAIFGTVIGTFGGCFAMRANLFVPIPPNYIVDDFFLTMSILEQRYWVIQEPSAICYEDVSDNLLEEFQRKKRISAGNFQNLRRFLPLLFNPQPKGLAFCFWSHKVLRWLTPFFLITLLVVGYLLWDYNIIYLYLLYLQILSIFLALGDYFLSKIRIHFVATRYLRYFYMMNIALFIGFFNYLKGIHTNVWRPTQRHINEP